MDVGWAVNAMKNGERVRRAIWPRLTVQAEHVALETATWIHLYYEHHEDGVPSVMAFRSDGKVSHFVMLDPYLLADDWELA